MSRPEAIEDARGREVAWDDLRERRVLAAIEARRATAAPRSRARASAPWIVGGALAAAAVVVVAVLGVPWSTTRDDAIPLALPSLEPAPATDPGATPAIPHVDPARLMLADGSSAQLGRAAAVQVVAQSDALVRLQQDTGMVRYAVTPDRARDFVVEARGVRVRVIGTVFAVDIGDDTVTVAVERGIVEVDADDRSVRLVAGDTVAMPIPAHAEGDDDADAIVIEDAAAVRPPGSSRAPAAVPSVDALLAEADAARAAGDPATAASVLGRLVSLHPRDPRVVSASFQLGKVERSRGRDAAAARAFERCVRHAPHGALAEDARAEAAVSWDAAGATDKARAAARAYLDRYPTGTHATRMRRLVPDDAP